MLDVPPTASRDDIKRAFRREIAKYHPDKVQHLGREFQEIAAVKAADLTLAYKILSDESLRADYDAGLDDGPPPGRAAPPPPQSPAPAPPVEPAAAATRATPAATAGTPVSSRDRGGASDLVRKAAVMRFRQALQQEFGHCEEAPAQGFDVICAPARGGFLSRSVPPRMAGRFVVEVSPAAVQESWHLASRLCKDQRDICVFIMGPAVAPAGELGHAINEQRRRPMAGSGKMVVIPINTRTWSAHVPTDAPPQVKALLARLRSG
jgi:hypothetical protein